MSAVNFVQVPLSQIFNVRSGNSKLTRSYMTQHTGQYPVYSAKTIGETVVGYIDSFAFDEAGLQLTTNGANAGTWLLREKHRYSLNGDARLYTIKVEYKDSLNLLYLLYELKRVFSEKGFDWCNKATQNKTCNILITIPILENGSFDKNRQIQFAEKENTLEEKSMCLLQQKTYLEACTIEADFSQSYRHIDVRISDLFTPVRGTGKYTKTYCYNHRGQYPVYSSNTKEAFFYIDTYDFDGNYLTWSTDGFAGNILIVKGKFSATDHRGVLVLKNQRHANLLDIDYLKYVIEPIFRRHAKGRAGHDGQNEYTSLKLNAVNGITDKIMIPIDDKGEFDLIAQKEIAKKYAIVNKVKNGMCSKIQQLVEIKYLLVN